MGSVDFHSHILPAVDDGSKDIETSIQMLREEKHQGVALVVATPHFYAWRDQIDKFVERRGSAYAELLDAMGECEAKVSRTIGEEQPIREESQFPELLLGSEVAYFSGISKVKGLDNLCIQGTKTILLEMPLEQWSSSYAQEVMQLKRNGYKVVLAHIERYMDDKKNRRILEELCSCGILMQINASSLQKWPGNAKLIKLFRNNQAHVLGSDCHNLTTRRPNLRQGYDAVVRKLGEERTREIDRIAYSLCGREQE